MKRLWMLALLLMGLTVTTVSAQGNPLDPAGTPNYGSLTLEAGFLPDPWIVSAISGGDIDVSVPVPGCVGFLTSTPDFTLQYSGTPLSGTLRILYVGSADSSLLVVDPNGNYVCNDNSATADPLIDFPNPAEGTYSIWVGSIGANNPAHGYLMITEVQSVPGAILTDIAGFITTLTQLTGVPVEATLEAQPDITPTPTS